MLEIKTKLKMSRAAYKLEVKGRLELPFELRQKSRFRTHLASGEEAAVMLPRGDVLRGGDLLVCSDGRIVEVVASPEKVVNVECVGPTELARAAYHLGNRHVAVQVGEGYLRLAADHVLEDMLRGLGAKLNTLEAPFEPEAGAYGGGHSHEEDGHGGKIHEYGEHDDHGHVHGPNCGHDHGHKHEHKHDHKHDHDAHAHDHGHVHGPDCGHDHGHDHAHDHGKKAEHAPHSHDHDHDHGHAHGHAHGHDEAHEGDHTHAHGKPHKH